MYPCVDAELLQKISYVGFKQETLYIEYKKRARFALLLLVRGSSLEIPGIVKDYVHIFSIGV